MITVAKSDTEALVFRNEDKWHHRTTGIYAMTRCKSLRLSVRTRIDMRIP